MNGESQRNSSKSMRIMSLSLEKNGSHLNDEEQDDETESRWREFMKDPYNNILDFDGLNQNRRKVIFPKLQEFLMDFLKNTDVKDKIKFRVNGLWHSKKLTHENAGQLFEKFIGENFIYQVPNWGDLKINYVSDAEIIEILEWSMFDSIGFERVKDVGNKNVEGSLFPHKNLSKIPLERYQILTKETYEKDKRKVSEILSEPCFIYALRQSGLIDKGTLNAILLRVRNRTLRQTDISWLCKEFGINLILHDIDDSRKEKNRLIRNEKGATKYKYKDGRYRAIERKVGNKNLGDEESLITIEMNCYKGHYFIEEQTNISSWYVDNIETALTSQMNGWHKGNTFFTPKDRSKYESRYLKSGQLIRRLMNKGYFEELKHIDLQLYCMRRDARLFDDFNDESCDENDNKFDEYDDEGPLYHDPDGSFCRSCSDEF